MKRNHSRRRIFKAAVGLAAVAAVLAGTATAAVSQGWFGLRDLELKQEVEAPEPEGSAPAESAVPDQALAGMISLQGFSDSPENRAVAEWQDFLAHYDDGGALEAIGNGPTGLEDDPDYQRFSLYLVYTREMLDRLKEITEKYGLTVHREINDVSHEELANRVGGEFLAVNHDNNWGYIYDDGTFQIDGGAVVSEYGRVDYQLRRAVKGVFDDVPLNVGDVSEYNQWQYETVSGETVLLALGPDKGLIFADFPDCFIAVNVLAGEGWIGPEESESQFWPGGLTAENLEELADGIDFSVLKDVKRPDMRGDSEVEEDPWSVERAGMEEAEAQEFYCAFYRAVMEDDRETAAGMIDFPRTLVVPDGEVTVDSAEEFLPYYDDIFTEEMVMEMMENQYDDTRADLFSRNGLVGGAGGGVWFWKIEDGHMGIITLQNPEGYSAR